MEREHRMTILVTPDELRLTRRSHADIVAVLEAIPRDAAVFALSRIARVIEIRGEVAYETQRFILDECLVSGRTRRRAIPLVENGAAFTCRASVIQLTRLALAHCRPGRFEVRDDERRRLVELLPDVNRHVVGGDLIDETRDLKRMRHAGSLITFLGATAGASESAEQTTSLAWAFAAICGNKAGARAESLDGSLRPQFGRSLRELHALFALTAAQFSHTEGPFIDVKAVPVSVRAPGAPVDARWAIDLLTCRSGETNARLEGASTPATAEIDPVRWRPFFQSGEGYVCWDWHTLLRLISFNFSEIIGLAAPLLIGEARQVWNEVVEDALSAVFVSTPARVTRLGERGGRVALARGRMTTGKVADWIVEADEDLFVLEWKNLVLPPRTFSSVDPDRFEAWVEEQLVESQGLSQVFTTIDRAREGWWQAGGGPGRPLDQFRRIWPVILIPFHMPFHILFEGMLIQAAGPLSDSISASVLNLQAPLVLHPWELVRLLSCRVQDRGALLIEWLALGAKRPPFFHGFLHSLGVEGAGLDALVSAAEGPLGELRQAAGDLRAIDRATLYRPVRGS